MSEVRTTGEGVADAEVAPSGPRWPGACFSRRRIVVSGLVAVPLASLWLMFNRPGRWMPRPPAGDRLAEVAVFLGLWLAVLAASRVRSRATWLAGAGAGLVMAVMRLAGAHFLPLAPWPFNPFGPTWPLELMVGWGVFTVLSTLVLSALMRARGPRTPPPPLHRAAIVRTVLGAWLTMLALWSPYLLMHWPGILVRDSWSSIFMGRGDVPMRNHHPVLFSRFVGACQWLASEFGLGPTAGVAIFSVVQAMVFAAGLAVCVVWVRARFGRGVALGTLAFFALNPFIAMWSITMHKDTLFVMVMTLTAVLLAEVARRGLALVTTPRWLALFVVALLCLSFTRNNGPYIAAGLVGAIGLLSLPRLLDLFRRDRDLRRNSLRWWAVPAAGLVTLVLVLTIQGPVYRKAGVIPGAHVESVGLQLQQVAWAVKFGKVTPEQEAVIAQFMPIDEMRAKYRVTLVDTLKFDPSFNTAWLDEHPDEFSELWWQIAEHNQRGYAKAWFGLSGGYLDPGAFFIRFDPGTKRGSARLVIDDRDLLGPSLGVDHLPRKWTNATARAASAPVLNLPFSMPLVTWACVLALCAAVLRRRPSAALPYLPYLFCVATLLVAAPLTEFRYVAAGHIGLPVLLLCMWAGTHVGESSSDTVDQPAGVHDADSDAAPQARDSGGSDEPVSLP